MEARLKNREDVTIIEVGGTLDIEHTQAFKHVVLKEFTQEKLVLDMKKALFVGSTGLGAFIETLKELSEKGTHAVKLTGLNNDFRRIFQNLQFQRLEFYETTDGAVESFTPTVQLPVGGYSISDSIQD